MSKGNLDDEALRREALQVCLQLPNDRAEALAVLRHAEHLICGYLWPLGEPASPAVLPMIRAV